MKAIENQHTSAELASRIYQTVAIIRAAELRLQHHIAEHGFGGFWHPGLGQEGLQAGAVAALRADDQLFYAHRGLGYALAKGMPLEALVGDLFGRVTGSTGGKGGGTVHFVDPERGVLGQGGTLGSSFVLGAGAAVSAQLQHSDRVVAVFFGDGAASRGTFHEAALQAAVWKLPVVWICENNGWALSAPIAEQSPTADIADRAAGYGMPGVVVDGQDALAVHEVTAAAVARARAGDGPTLIEAKTLRVRGHYEGDRQPYRTDLDPAGPEIPRDPVLLLREIVPAEVADRFDADARALVDEVFEATLAADRADPSIVLDGVWAP
ncbi:MAG TPA: thiamine pyrophosphate-dependent dehydrogenase E1 component subunit alpha [Solirubrobacteraceae bacterium]|jgi:pyruvate dehydrogenase E1 component alpha subunit|nr:thiamine pyrophosphate-dependent dehydrogenase E1 component subunit alpha [Solirubrobacteraceae bacterium]